MAETPKNGEQGNDNTLSGTILGSMSRFLGDAKGYVESKKKSKGEVVKAPEAAKPDGKQETAAVAADTQQKTEQLKTTVSRDAFLSKLDKLYNEGLTKITGLTYPDAIKDKAKADLAEKYKSIKAKVEACNSDAVLKNNKDILSALNSWITELQNINMPDITGEAVAGLGLLKADISGAQATPSSGSEAPAQATAEAPKDGEAETKAASAERKTKFMETLKGYGLPPMVAGIIAFLFGSMGHFDKKDSFIAKAIDFISNPVDGLKSMVGMNGGAESLNNGLKILAKETVKKGEIVKDDVKKTVNYKNDRVAIALKDGKVESVLIGGVPYNLKLKDVKNSALSQVSFVQNDKGDFIKFGNKEIDILAFTASIQTGSLESNYILEKEFSAGDDLRLDKIA
ncbi:MAG: hypothetical protein PHS92_03160 [Candidatus Gracilibacteria bacterium]|nr:hypothetical protein [Candidatus Gracilibacteria bacterium]